MNTWDLIKIQLKSTLSTDSYQNWVSNTEFSHIQDNKLCVIVPNEETRAWMATEYSGFVNSVIRELGLNLSSVVYELAAAPTGRSSNGSAFSNSTPKEDIFDSTRTPLNPRFTFENFVVGSCNQFAHAAAQSVATSPSRRYNPLFIYEMITCIRMDRMAQFHTFYRSADVLLVDDIHVLGGKERTQEEFFHTFNDLYEHQKQIVISSDSTPKEIPGLVERLRSRFEWGLMVDMQPPDLETKMAILDKKAESEGIRLPEDVRIFMATKTKSNVRELEGGLVKLMAFSSLTGAPITMQMAQQVLKHLVHSQERRVSIDSIQKVVAEHFQLKQTQLKEKSNTRTIAYPRQIAMYLVKEMTQASLPEIGRSFGGKHHTTVLHSIHKIERLRQSDQDFNRLIHRLIDSLQ